MSGALQARGVLIEAETFDDLGGWTLDSQFEIQMGSPYLLAHGLGRPVADAHTTVTVREPGEYQVWVRTKDWVPEHHPGRFLLSIDGKRLDREFGASGLDWGWESGGRVCLRSGPVELALRDLTGFDGRCDAIFLGLSETPPPNGAGDDALAWRRRERGLPDQPDEVRPFDVVVVGGGVAGSAATLTCARLGLRVALVQNRPFLGGNASVEIGLTPRGETGGVVRELSAREPNGDLRAAALIGMEPNATLFTEHQVYRVASVGGSITSVDAREARTGIERRLSAPLFIDCTGTAILGLLAGAPTMFGIESKAEYGESLAPDERLEQHHGHTIFFRTREADHAVDFPSVPWATEVAKDFANLGGQLQRPGVDNVEGPVAGPARTPDPNIRRRMLQPLTHFWEYGQWLDPYVDGEHIRDHLLRAIYGTLSNVRALEPETWANLEFDWVGYVPGQGEFHRYVGDYVLTETDIREHRHFDDVVVHNSGAFCLHHPIDDRYDFRLKDWTWDTRDGEPFGIPFRCLYSATVDNLMMAGKHISVTHVAGSVTKFLGNGGQHAVATAAAAWLCTKYGLPPRGIHDQHLAELQDLCGTLISN